MGEKISIIGKTLIIFIGLNLFFATGAVLLNQQISGLFFILALILSMVMLSLITYRRTMSTRTSLAMLAVFISVIGVSLFLAGAITDFSWDGQTYHQEAILQLHRGWNPLYNGDLYNYLGNEVDHSFLAPFWINHYPKGLWYLETIIYDLFGRIDYGKAINFISWFATLFISYGLIDKIVKKKFLAPILAVVLLLNPVIINQLFTFYNDGMLFLYYIILLVVSIEWFFNQKNFLTYATMAVAINVLTNIKFTAFGYGVVLMFIPVALIMWDAYKKSDFKVVFAKNYLKFYLVAGLSFIFALGVVGASSYVQNTLSNGHPFYPLAGQGKVDIMSYNTPEKLKSMNKIERMYLSLYSETTNDREKPLLSKFPLSATKDELFQSTKVDTRIGGFGPYFGLVMTLTAIAFAIWLCQTPFKYAAKYKLYFLVIGTILLTIIINPETWWARYIPQLWLIPLITVILLSFSKSLQKNMLAFLIVALLGFNGARVAYHSFKLTYEREQKSEQQMAILAEEESINVKFDSFRSNRNRFKENNVNFKEVNQTTNFKYKINLVGSTTSLLTNDEQLYKKLVEVK